MTDVWITIDAYCEKYGERKNVVNVRVTEGHWKRGVDVSSPDPKTTLVNETRALAWLTERGKLPAGGATPGGATPPASPGTP